jgi:transposase InsO family protein
LGETVNGPEYVAHKVCEFIEDEGSKTLFVTPGSPWENGFVESFNSRLRDEVLNREDFWNLLDAKTILEDFRVYYNEERPHSS